MSKKPKGYPYSVHPTVGLVRNWIASLPQKSGRSLEEWVALLKAEGPELESTDKAFESEHFGVEQQRWLKDKYKLNTYTAHWIVQSAAGKPMVDGDPDAYLEEAPRLVDRMFEGKKAHLRPLYEQLLKLGLELGEDVKICPCKTIVPFYRNHVFAEIKPSTKTRIDLGFALKDRALKGRLVDTGGFKKGDRITHRIPITKAEDIDDEVKQWLKIAYDMDL